jgi:hypothetical protein
VVCKVVAVAGEGVVDGPLGSGGGLDMSKRSSDSTSRAGGGDGIGGIGTVGVARDGAGALGVSGSAVVAVVEEGPLSAAALPTSDRDGGSGTSGNSVGNGSAVRPGPVPVSVSGGEPNNGFAGMIVTSGNGIGSAAGAGTDVSTSGAGSATIAVGLSISGGGASILAGSPERIAGRSAWPRCVETAINTAVVMTAADVPAIVGVRNGVGRALGPSAAIAANIALTARSPSAMDASPVEPRSRPATNVTNAMHTTTTTASAREMTKARIALSRTRYNQIKVPQLNVAS